MPAPRRASRKSRRIDRIPEAAELPFSGATRRGEVSAFSGTGTMTSNNGIARELKTSEKPGCIPEPTSVQQAVPIISLMRLISEVGNEPLHIGHAHAKGRAGLRDNILLAHDASKIIRTALERDLSDLLTLCYPRTLDVRNVIEVNARKG